MKYIIVLKDNSIFCTDNITNDQIENTMKNRDILFIINKINNTCIAKDYKKWEPIKWDGGS